MKKNLVQFSDIKDKIFNHLKNYNNNAGIKSDDFPSLNKSLKGLRRGEFTVLTGGTGSGKTTFLTQYSLDFAKKVYNFFEFYKKLKFLFYSSIEFI